MPKMSSTWEPCPRCGSIRIDERGKLFWFLVPFASGGCLVWFGLLFPLFWIFAFLLILLSPLGFFMPKIHHCKDCNYSWKAQKKGKAETPAN